jgi:hypothetical protein
VPGEYGEQQEERRRSSQYVRLNAKAIIAHWDTPEETRPEVIDFLTDAVRGTIDVDPRTRLLAAKALMETARLQVTAAQLAMQQREHSDERKDRGAKTATRRAVVERAKQIALERDRRTDGASGAELP